MYLSIALYCCDRWVEHNATALKRPRGRRLDVHVRCLLFVRRTQTCYADFTSNEIIGTTCTTYMDVEYKGLRCSFESSESIELQLGRNGCGGGGFLSAACGGGTLWVLRGSSGRERRLVGGRKELSQQIARVPYDSQRARCFSRSSVACVSVFFTHNQKF